MSAMKKQLTWKFGFQKKLRLNYENREGDESNVSARFSQPENLYCNLVDIVKEPIYENNRVECDPVYENTCLGDPIYEPVNVFLGLVHREEIVSPDPNIYEVPPGAIKTCVDSEEPDTHSLLPPPGFLDYENMYVMRTGEEGKTMKKEDDIVKHKVLITFDDVNQENVSITQSNTVELEVDVEQNTNNEAAEQQEKVMIKSSDRVKEETTDDTVIAAGGGKLTLDDVKWDKAVIMRNDAEQEIIMVKREDAIQQGNVINTSEEDDTEHEMVTVIRNDRKQEEMMVSRDDVREEEKAMIKQVDATELVKDVYKENYVLMQEKVANKQDGAVDLEKVVVAQADLTKQEKIVIRSENEDLIKVVKIAEQEKIQITCDDAVHENVERCNVTWSGAIENGRINTRDDGVMITQNDFIVHDEVMITQDETDRKFMITKDDLLSEEEVTISQDCVVKKDKVVIIQDDAGEEDKTMLTEEKRIVSGQDDNNCNSFIEISDDGTWETRNMMKEIRRAIEKQGVRSKQIVHKNGGEVVCDSIIENKQKTKSYWEQLMMAAELPRALSLGSDCEDASEQEYFDARSQLSAHSPAEPVEAVDQVYGPKIVETVAKKLMEVETTKVVRSTGDESVIERDIRLQREREEAVAREREEALVRAAARLSKDEPDDGFNSIPNTDSEYGSEEKDSRIMSPEGFLHQRTQSLDSMSSGHSSGSGDTGGGRRRVIVKPLDEPEEDQVLTYMRNQKETPIEREIRLAREREEELRREKGLPPLNSQFTPVSGKQEVRKFNLRSSLLANDPRSMQHRLATSRIQQEINEATEREKELREAGTIHTTSEETVDSKVTRFTDLAEFSIEEQDRKLHKSVSTSHIPQSINDSPLTPSSTPTPKVENTRHQTVARSLSQSPVNSGLSVRKFPKNLGQKGLMQRFLAARGKMGMGTLSSGFVTSPNSQQKSAEVPEERPVIRRHSLVQDTASSQAYEGKENGEVEKSPTRRGYISAEEKIQVELEEMQKREEELRLQRARMFAQSQPNLLSIGVDETDEQEVGERGDILLRSALSNPNLHNSESTQNGEEESSLDKPTLNSIKKHTALIAQWEDMIQKNIDH